MAIGPSLEVSTDDPRSTAWLGHNLIHEYDNHDSRIMDLDESAHSVWQFPDGILLGIDSNRVESLVTEVLLYAAIERGHDSDPVLPDPSVTKALNQDGSNDLPSEGAVRIFALPLCSDILLRIKGASQENLQAPWRKYSQEPDHNGSTLLQVAQKKQKLSNVFEDATRQRKHLKARGGERVSRVMAEGRNGLALEQNQKHYDTDHVSLAEPKTGDLGNRKISRISTSVSGPGFDESRPQSRNSLSKGKMMPADRIENVLSPSESLVPSKGETNVAQQNKAALTKVVMAGMRIHGLQNRRRDVKDPHISLMSQHSEVAANDAGDEYKLVYHQTFKAASFAFRANISSQIISQSVMRNVVDQLLLLFCADPTMSNSFEDGPDTIAQAGQLDSCAFDPPSSGAPISASDVNWTTPTKQKRAF